ncbi:MAG: diadenylate cyclase, partial [Clostridia bacterium]|nr:diadenylate cyclase [Clostridia bacterium]
QNCVKVQSLRKIVNGKPFHELSRRLRQELVSMDGATIIDSDGSIIAVGAIIKIEAGSEGGGRLAAATTLSKYGIAIKISQDGIMKAFYPDKKTNKSKLLFSVG